MDISRKLRPASLLLVGAAVTAQAQAQETDSETPIDEVIVRCARVFPKSC